MSEENAEVQENANDKNIKPGAVPVVDYRLLAGKLTEYNWLEGVSEGPSPSEIVEVRFKNTRKGFYTNPSKLNLKVGDIVAVEAALGHDVGIVSMTGELVREQMEVNYFGPLLVGNVFLPLLRRNPRSLVIFISSIAGRVPIPFQSHYSSSKYALEAYAEALRMEGKRHGLTTVLIEPGDTKTGFTSMRRKCIPEDSVYKAEAEKAIAKMEKDEMNGKSPETVAKAALAAASRRNPPVRKPVGAEYSFLMILLRILPDKAALWILGKMY